MKVCLINFPFVNDHFIGREYGKFEQYEQNMELACIASYLEENGINTDIIECTPLKYNVATLADYFKNKLYFALILSVEDYTFYNVVRFLNKITWNGPVIFAGEFSARNYDKLLRMRPKNSYCLISNKEQSCLRILQNELQHGNRSDLRDVAYFDKSIVVGDASDGLDFKYLPLPKRVYVSENGMAGIESTRGCNNNCIYCTVNVRRSHEKKHYIQYKPTEKLLEEIEGLVTDYGVKYIRFHDENFLNASATNRKRLIALCKGIKNKKLSFSFKVFARATDLIKNRDILPDMKSIGMEAVFVGIESFVQRQLDFYRKNTTVQQNIEAINILNDNNIKFTIGFLPLDPYVTLEELEQNYSLLKKIEYSKVSLYTNLPISCIPELNVLPGSAFHKIVLLDGLRANNERGYRFVNSVIEVFNCMKEQWSKEVIKVHNLSYLISKAELSNEKSLLEELKKAKSNLMDLDLECLLDFVKQLRQVNNSKIQIDNMFVERLKEIEQVFSVAKEKLD